MDNIFAITDNYGGLHGNFLLAFFQSIGCLVAFGIIIVSVILLGEYIENKFKIKLR